jgi:signal transduction histidine kinase/HPt (histidine-containing phosphotransfer) domain-containing protein
MQKLSLQVKIGTLMTLAILLISATGYLSFRSLSAIVSSIRVKSKPDQRLLKIREISNDLDKADNSVRIFTYTRGRKDIEPYYATIAVFDDKITGLRNASAGDPTLLVQIDTISKLIEENIVIWNEMLDLYHSDSLENYIRKLTAKLAVGTLSNKNTDKSILKRVFSKRSEKNQVQEEIIRDLNKIEKQDSLHNLRLLATESQLAITGKEIRERFYILIAKMEDEVAESAVKNAQAADRLALQTYRWLAMFALLGTLLVILVLIIVVRFVRKTHDYQVALIRSKEETEKLARTREMFMANMSHEIRTPVNAISGFTEQLGYHSFDDKSRKILDIIKSSSDHLVKIVNDILDISKLQNARIVLERTSFRIRVVCEEVQLLFENKSSEKNTRLFFTLYPSTPAVLLGDSYRLKQILINLVGNAVKFTTGGEIQVSVDSEFKPDQAIDLILSVRDTGIGISEDMQDKVFDDFMQAEADTSRKYGGTGLGLSIVKKLVDLHGGTIQLKSRKNKGTTITCVLPYAVGNEKEITDISRPLKVPGRIKGLRILVVDDEEYNRMLFSTIFDRWKVQYDQAVDGLHAIEMIKTNRYDLVFMDIRMPGLGGLESSAVIRDELRITQVDLPLIGISATHTAEDIQQYKASGFNAFLPKPFTEKMLLESLISILEPAGQTVSIPEPGVAAGSVAADPVINLSHLYQLADNDLPFIKQMLVRFIETTEEGLLEIRSAIREGNTKAAMETAHKLAAPCQHLGVDKLYSNLKAIENMAQNNINNKMLANLSGDSDKEFAGIKEILKAHLIKMEENGR